MIKLGRIGKDLITGFEGVVMGRAEYLTGCTQILLTPRSLDKEGNRREGQWFDEQRVLGVGLAEIDLDNGTTPGADEPAAPTR